MQRDELTELCFITPIDNVPSILRHGILSKRQVEGRGIGHRSVAMQEIQDLRENVVVPGGRPLHTYANLYICPRNPMMWKRRAHHAALCVLRVSQAVLDFPGTVVTDGNAASEYARFEPAPDGLAIVDGARTFAEWWISDIPGDAHRRRFQKCAEVLVADRVPPEYITGAYVSGNAGRDALNALGTGLAITVDAQMFFQ